MAGKLGSILILSTPLEASEPKRELWMRLLGHIVFCTQTPKL